MQLLDAAAGDAEQFQNAVATIDLWWPTMPQQLRNSIDTRLADWIAEHPKANRPDALNKRCMLMLLRHLKPPRSGAHLLRAALRLPP